MYVGGSSAKGIFACVSVSATAKTNIYFDNLWQKACNDIAHSSLTKSGVTI